MSLFFFVLSRCHSFFFFFISLFLSLFCPPSPVRGETILLALCHLSFLFYQGVTSSSSLSLYFSLCFVCPAELMEKQFYLLYVTFLFFSFFIKVSLLLLVYLFISLFVLSAPSPVRGETILLALCHFSFLFYQGVR